MNDLISRKVVMDYLREQQAIVITAENKGVFDEEVRKGMNSAINTFINFIVQCPTAYNVDKLLEENKQLKFRCYQSTSGTICFCCLLECKHRKEAFRGDVKAGGVNE